MGLFSKKVVKPSTISQVKSLCTLGLQLGVTYGVARVVSHNVDQLLGKIPGVQSAADFERELARIKAGTKP